MQQPVNMTLKVKKQKNLLIYVNNKKLKILYFYLHRMFIMKVQKN